MNFNDCHTSVNDFIFINNDNFINNYFGNCISYKVKLAISIHTKNKYILKIFDKSVLNYNNEKIMNEIILLKNLKNPYIIKLYNFFENEKNIYLIFEYAEKGNLSDYLNKKNNLKESEAMFYIIQLLIAVNYFNKYELIHKSIYSDNLLLNYKGNIKLINFNLSDNETNKINIDYKAPEILKYEKYDKSIDIWSIGILLYELTQGYLPFEGQTKEEKMKNILNKNIKKMKIKISTGCKDFINKLLEYNPDKRININNIINLEYIKLFCEKYEINLKKYFNKNINLSTLSSLNNEKSFSKFSHKSKINNEENINNITKSLINKQNEIDEINNLIEEFIHPSKENSFVKKLTNNKIKQVNKEIDEEIMNFNFNESIQKISKEQKNEINKMKLNFYDNKNIIKKKANGFFDNQKYNINNLWNSLLSNIGCFSN